MSNHPAAPRETNPARLTSQLRRTLALVHRASRQYRADRNIGTATRRRERTLAALALRAKVAIVRVAARPTKGPGSLAGAARLAALRRAVRTFRARHAAWEAFYRGGVSL